jgi:hypothetical protein
MTGIGTGLAALSASQKLMRVGIAVGLLLLVIGAIALWGHSKYKAGHEAGVTETDAAWQKASDELMREAGKSATKADDRAVAALEEHKEQISEDRAALEKAKEEGSSPFDALFGSQ